MMMTEELPVKRIDFSDLGFWDVNLTTMEITLCERAREIFDINKECRLSLSYIFKRVGQAQIRELVLKLKSSFSPGSRFKHELTLVVNPENEPKRIRLNGYVDFNDALRPGRIIGAITELPEMEDTGLKKSDLLAIVSHELKSPLTTIKLYIQLAEKIIGRNSVMDIAKYLDLAVREVDNMNLLMDNFLNLTSIETGSFKLYSKRFDLSLLIMEIVDYWTRNTSTHDFHYDEIPSIFINADRLKIKQVIHNLISNAVKYSAPHSKIEISCRDTGGEAEICVKDQGEGISEHDQVKLFSRFSRVGAQQRGEIAGHGIGLYLIKEIIAGHRGKVWLKSKTGQGSEFYISLPKMLKEL